jgi:hypothetical protein
MSRWAREHPEEMDRIASLPWQEQNDAMRAAVSETLTCLDYGRGPCRGPVEMRWPGHGHRNFPRCEAHQEKRLEQAEADNAKYPDSPIAPEWFDPLAAGETWDEPD